MVKKLLPILPAHDVYVEPFVGGGSLFFAKPLAPKGNVISDIDPQLVGFYKNVSCPMLKACVKVKPTIPERRRRIERFQHGSRDACDFLMANRFSVNRNMKNVYLRESEHGPWGQNRASKCGDYTAKLKAATIKRGDFR